MRLVMQGYADRLSDDEVAALASFVRGAWGNDGAEVTAEEVTQQRESAVARHGGEESGS